MSENVKVSILKRDVGEMAVAFKSVGDFNRTERQCEIAVDMLSRLGFVETVGEANDLIDCLKEFKGV